MKSAVNEKGGLIMIIPRKQMQNIVEELEGTIQKLRYYTNWNLSFRCSAGDKSKTG